MNWKRTRIEGPGTERGASGTTTHFEVVVSGN